MSTHMERRNEVPFDQYFFFSEKTYIKLLKTYERECEAFDANGGAFDANGGADGTSFGAHELTLRRLKSTFKHMGPSDSIRHEFIQHYLAYHRSKIYALDCAIALFSQAAAVRKHAQDEERARARAHAAAEQLLQPPYHPYAQAGLALQQEDLRIDVRDAMVQDQDEEQRIDHRDDMHQDELYKRRQFHRQQCTFLQRILVHRSGQAQHMNHALHSAGQHFYNKVRDRDIAAVYEADRADRSAFELHGSRARGHSSLLYVGDTFINHDGLRVVYNGDDMPWSAADESAADESGDHPMF